MIKTASILFPLIFSFGVTTKAPEQNVLNKITAGDIINKVHGELTCGPLENTVDTYKAGNDNTEVTGIVTTFTTTLEVLKKAKDMGCNMIITHEPTYYNHTDEITDLKNDQVLLKKKKFIEDNNFVVWRFHDHWHCTQPDGIYKGMVKQLNLEDNLVDGANNVFKIEETTLEKFAKQLKSIYPTSNMRIIGAPEMKFTKVGFSAGAPGSISQIRMLQREDVEVLIAGETREWETVEYTRDAVEAGYNKACILLGHAISEEGGMEYCAEWLKGFIDEVPVHFIAAGDPFWTP